ncbi:MBL fold metallo-hydrolase [uncultured Aquimarina sp.]|uniref:ComEC/Rec2 family competence protein n=1 Tax=uncultured Aquimarina sp. TaxID=575652 RepID=UPI0026337BD6|nr:MBL fold metallo-hydrolase [uncultured Aquimarina sp.]
MSDTISIELFPAGNGDAILLDFGEALILIDTGYISTFRDHLKPRLKTLHSEGRRLTKFVVTHIDADHISGAIAFINENGEANNPSVIGIDEVWFNSYRHLNFEDKEEGDLNGSIPDIPIVGGKESIETENEIQLVSYEQGTSLGSLLLKYGYKWNTTFNSLAVKTDQPLKLKLSDNLELTLLGPTQTSLDKMANTWYRYLKKIFAGKINQDSYFDDAFEKMMEEMRQADLDEAILDEEMLVSTFGDWVENYNKPWEKEDKSPTNGSSIIFLLEYRDIKLLFLGDAIPSQVEEQLKKMIPEDQFPLQIDVLKVAHHGAWKNNSPELIKMVQAKYYLFSSNGRRHRHPNFETMASILNNHPVASYKTFVFNYKQGDRLLDIDDDMSKQKYNYDTLWPDVDEWGNGVDGYVKLRI